MRLSKASSVEELQIISRFEALRKILLGPQYAEHIGKPLAYWTLPTDRRLPLAFLGRTLRDLLNAPFSELAATPGIGRKKMHSFVRLLARAANTDPAEMLVELDGLETGLAFDGGPCGDGQGNGANHHDVTDISEISWAQWRATVVRHGLGHERLGRFAPSLKNMTRVIWNAPLGAYTDATLAEIRTCGHTARSDPGHPGGLSQRPRDDRNWACRSTSWCGSCPA